MQRRVHYDRARTLGDAVGNLELELGRPTIVVIGSAARFDEAFANRIERLLEMAVAPICRSVGAAVVYGGTNVGVMAVLGRVLAEFAAEVPLIGVAPRELVRFENDVLSGMQAHADPHHTHFVTSPGEEWGDEGIALIGVGERVAKDSSIVVLVLGGGPGTLIEISLACQRGWPVLLVEGVEGVGHALAQELTPSRTGDLNASAGAQLTEADTDIRDSVTAGRLAVRRLGDIDGVRRALAWRLSPDSLLKEAWLRLGNLDAAAAAAKPKLLRARIVVLFLGVLTALLAIGAPLLPESLAVVGRLMLVVIPVLSAGVMAASARRRVDDRWLSARAVAQALAAEIYRYRTSAGEYWDARARDEHRRLFATSIASVDARLSGGASIGVRPPTFAFWPPTIVEVSIDPRDPLLGELDGRTYDDVRVEGQLTYFGQASARVDASLGRWLVAIYLGGAAASLLGALAVRYAGYEVWIAPIAAAAVAVSAWIDSQQMERQIAQTSLAVASVRAARDRWLAQEPAVRATAVSVSRYAAEIEEALMSELNHWELAFRQAHRSFASFVAPQQ